MTQVIVSNLMQPSHIEAFRYRVAEETEKNKGKKVIHFLKEEMSNIREGMSKLIRAKSEQNLKFQLKLSTQQDFCRKNKKNQVVSNFHHSPELQLKQLRQRVKFLQTRNMSLESELKQKNLRDLTKNEQMATLQQWKKSLEIQNQAMARHITGLVEHIEKLNLQIQQNLANTNIKATETIKQSGLNPQGQQLNRLKQRSPWQSYERLRRQYNQLVTGQNYVKQVVIVQKQKMIEGLNRQVIGLSMEKLNKKYQTLIEQQQLF